MTLSLSKTKSSSVSLRIGPNVVVDAAALRCAEHAAFLSGWQDGLVGEYETVEATPPAGGSLVDIADVVGTLNVTVGVLRRLLQMVQQRAVQGTVVSQPTVSCATRRRLHQRPRASHCP
jgi:hypothetical protein